MQSSCRHLLTVSLTEKPRQVTAQRCLALAIDYIHCMRIHHVYEIHKFMTIDMMAQVKDLLHLILFPGPNSA